MPSPNFDLMNVALSRRIGDPVASASANGKRFTDDERDTYLNNAMGRLVEEILVSVQGDNGKFLEILPELFAVTSITTAGGGTYTITNPNADFFKMVDGFKGSTYIKVLPKAMFNIVKLGVNSMYNPSASNLFAFESEGILYFFPASEFNTQGVTFNYIKRPVDPFGAFFTNGGTYDIPFYPHWHNKIVEIAEAIVKADNQLNN